MAQDSATEHPPKREPSLPEAVERVLEVSTEVLGRKLDLLEHDVRAATRSVFRGAGRFAATAFFLAVAWLAVNAGVYAMAVDRAGAGPACLGLAALNLFAAVLSRAPGRDRAASPGGAER